ncbi:flagellar hook protein FlgE [Bacillus sp. S/N-304-OC-R1]|uniref:flagellar hook protein FlgE n=1 Tax=Bacillus sp. S/N-304-OC-R1 TaxID=2758034 RepID=UPI001C8E3569|nr:flagellar hook-basal body complex protein [Bacillus sp. S/N-304-OC-R1]MBY0120689.1 flagellar hook-basal body complex protein [Bacillus sp. S/N-304-OC-R1]
MLRSMYSGISGLRNFQTKLDVIGNNIANVNTAGFKKGRVTFKDAMSQTIAGASASTDNRGGKNAMQVGLGSSLASIDTIHTGSSLQSTNRPQDLSIEGDGYFVVKQGNAQYYTRAGNFYLDDKGALVNGDGYKVQAYKYAADGKTLTNNYGDVAINVNAVLPATPTDQISVSGNLDVGAIEGTIITQQIKVIDEKGKVHDLDVHYKKTSADEWQVYYGGVTRKELEDDDTIAGQLKITVGTDGKLTLDPVDGSAISIILGKDENDDDIELKPKIAIGDISVDKGGTTAFSDPNGYLEGKLESFSIGAMGEINGVYSNGEIATLGRLAIAKFSNTSGLNKTGSNLFQETISSGTANVGAAGDGRGTIASGTLEMSNVDLSEEFTEMITAQRGFQANTRIITTSDEILQELVNLKR